MAELATRTPEITTPSDFQDYSRIAEEIRDLMESSSSSPTRQNDIKKLVSKIKHDWEMIVKTRTKLEDMCLTHAKVNGDSQISFFEQKDQASYTEVTTTLISPLPMSDLDVQIDFVSHGRPNPSNLRSISISTIAPTPPNKPNVTTEIRAGIFIASDGATAELSYSKRESNVLTAKIS